MSENIKKARRWVEIILKQPKEDSWFQAVQAKDSILKTIIEIDELQARIAKLEAAYKVTCDDLMMRSCCCLKIIKDNFNKEAEAKEA